MGGWKSGVFGEASPIGKDKNLTNCEIYRAGEKSPVVCGELVSLVGYIPGVEMKTDTKKKTVEITVRPPGSQRHVVEFHDFLRGDDGFALVKQGLSRFRQV